MMKYLEAIVLVTLLMVSFIACGTKASPHDTVIKAIHETSEAQSYRASGIMEFPNDAESIPSHYDEEFTTPDRYYSKVRNDDTWYESITIADTIYIRSSYQPQWQIRESIVDDALKSLFEPPIPYPSKTHFSSTPIDSTTSDTPKPHPATTITITGAGEDSLPIYTPEGYVTNQGTYQNTIFFNTPLPEMLHPLQFLVDIELLTPEEIDGVICSHYKGRIDQAQYVEMLIDNAKDALDRTVEDQIELTEIYEGLREQQINIEIWLDENDYIKRLIREYHFPDTDAVAIDITNYYDFNEPISIEPPSTK